jgi:HAD superfamily hydrolase (TIGR01450 family)
MTMITDTSFINWFEARQGDWDALCFDIDGTLIRGVRPMPGAVELIERLRRDQVPFLLLTNDGNHSVNEKQSFLRKAGLEIEPAEIVSCGMAIAQTVAARGLQGQKFFVMGELGDPSYAELAGLRHIRDSREIDSCAGVLIGETNYDWESVFNAVVNYFIDHPQAPLLVPNPDTYWPHHTHGIGIGAGGKARFIDLILREYGLTIEIVYLGKPHRAIYEQALNTLRQGGAPVSPARVLMVGDSLRSDILGARQAGFASALVLTGITGPEQLRKSQIQPDFVFSSLE